MNDNLEGARKASSLSTFRSIPRLILVEGVISRVQPAIISRACGQPSPTFSVLRRLVENTWSTGREDLPLLCSRRLRGELGSTVCCHSFGVVAFFLSGEHRGACPLSSQPQLAPVGNCHSATGAPPGHTVTEIGTTGQRNQAPAIGEARRGGGGGSVTPHPKTPRHRKPKTSRHRGCRGSLRTTALGEETARRRGARDGVGGSWKGGGGAWVAHYGGWPGGGTGRATARRSRRRPH